jgi:hypothetical protein
MTAENISSLAPIPNLGIQELRIRNIYLPPILKSAVNLKGDGGAIARSYTRPRLLCRL